MHSRAPRFIRAKLRDYVRTVLSACRLRSLSRLYARAERKTRGCTHAVVARARVHNYLNPVNIPTDKRAARAEGGSRENWREGGKGRWTIGKSRDRGRPRQRSLRARARETSRMSRMRPCSLYSPRDGTCFEHWIEQLQR